MAKKLSISFKEKESYMWEYMQQQLNPAYYIKMLILKDMQEKDVVKNIKIEKEIKTKNGLENLMDFDF